jgi:hypothetical protein
LKGVDSRRERSCGCGEDWTGRTREVKVKLFLDIFEEDGENLAMEIRK